jgi:hypothetical protein
MPESKALEIRKRKCQKAKLLKSEKENASLIKDFEEKIMPGSSPEGLNDALVTREQERTSRASPATKEDVQTICSELFTSSLKLQYERQREELTRQNQTQLEDFTAFVREHMISKENSRLRDEVAELKQRVLQYEQQNKKLMNECSDVTEHNSHLAIQLRQQKQNCQQRTSEHAHILIERDKFQSALARSV